MPYCITLRSRTDALITGWYDGSDSRWSTDRYRQKVFDNKRDARPVCDELRGLCRRNAEVIKHRSRAGRPFSRCGSGDVLARDGVLVGREGANGGQ